MADQEDVVAGERDMGGTMRLGLYPAALAEGSMVRELYGEPVVQERHRHRYEVNNAYRSELEKAGLSFSGLSPDGRLVEFIELPASMHPLLRGDPGAPGTAVPADPAASAVQRPDRGRAGAQPGASRPAMPSRPEPGGRLRAPEWPDHAAGLGDTDEPGSWPVTGTSVLASRPDRHGQRRTRSGCPTAS